MYSKFWWCSIEHAKSISEDHKMCTAIISWYANTKSNSHNTPMTSSQDPKTPRIKDNYLAKKDRTPEIPPRGLCQPKQELSGHKNFATALWILFGL